MDSNIIDELERHATELYYRTYGAPTSDEERIFVQRGISVMRYAFVVKLDEIYDDSLDPSPLVEEVERLQQRYNEWARNATPQERAEQAEASLRGMPGQAYLFTHDRASDE